MLTLQKLKSQGATKQFKLKRCIEANCLNLQITAIFQKNVMYSIYFMALDEINSENLTGIFHNVFKKIFTTE